MFQKWKNKFYEMKKYFLENIYKLLRIDITYK